MLVYKDIFSGDEMISDSYGQHPVMDGDEVVPGMFEVESRMIAVGGEQVDIGCGNEFGGGDEEVDDTVEKENNIISERAGFGYTEFPMSKADLKEYLKEYMRKIRQHLKSKGTPVETIKQFMEEAGVIAKFLIIKADDLQTYMGRTMDPEAGLAFAYYKDGAVTPTFMYIKWGLEEEKF